jgi:hypothetical protein
VAVEVISLSAIVIILITAEHKNYQAVPLTSSVSEEITCKNPYNGEIVYHAISENHQVQGEWMYKIYRDAHTTDFILKSPGGDVFCVTTEHH